MAKDLTAKNVAHEEVANEAPVQENSVRDEYVPNDAFKTSTNPAEATPRQLFADNGFGADLSTTGEATLLTTKEAILAGIEVLEERNPNWKGLFNYDIISSEESRYLIDVPVVFTQQKGKVFYHPIIIAALAEGKAPDTVTQKVPYGIFEGTAGAVHNGLESLTMDIMPSQIPSDSEWNETVASILSQRNPDLKGEEFILAGTTLVDSDYTVLKTSSAILREAMSALDYSMGAHGVRPISVVNLPQLAKTQIEVHTTYNSNAVTTDNLGNVSDSSFTLALRPTLEKREEVAASIRRGEAGEDLGSLYGFIDQHYLGKEIVDGLVRDSQVPNNQGRRYDAGLSYLAVAVIQGVERPRTGSSLHNTLLQIASITKLEENHDWWSALYPANTAGSKINIGTIGFETDPSVDFTKGKPMVPLGAAFGTSVAEYTKEKHSQVMSRMYHESLAVMIDVPGFGAAGTALAPFKCGFSGYADIWQAALDITGGCIANYFTPKKNATDGNGGDIMVRSLGLLPTGYLTNSKGKATKTPISSVLKYLNVLNHYKGNSEAMAEWSTFMESGTIHESAVYHRAIQYVNELTNNSWVQTGYCSREQISNEFLVALANGLRDNKIAGDRGIEFMTNSSGFMVMDTQRRISGIQLPMTNLGNGNSAQRVGGGTNGGQQTFGHGISAY